jgi:transcriptional regulator with XRE-family HTH domain
MAGQNMDKMQIRKLGEYLREKRVRADLTQGWVAERMGFTSPQFISNIERGLCSPPMDVLKRMVRLYKLRNPEVVKFLSRLQEEYFERSLR